MKLYYAIASIDQKFEPTLHAREDEKILRLRLFQNEGEKAVLRCQVPAQNFAAELYVSKKVFLSADVGDGVVKVLFTGILSGAPKKVFDDVMEVTLVSYHPDQSSDELTLLTQLRKSNAGDSLFDACRKSDDLSKALASRTEVLHWNRLTGCLELSDFFRGSIAGPTQLPIHAGTLKAVSHQPCYTQVDVEVRAAWTQQASGVVDIAPSIAHAFGGTINSFSGEGLQKIWAREGSLIGGGAYYVCKSHLTQITPPKTGGLDIYPCRSAYRVTEKPSVKYSDFILWDDAQQKSAFKRFWYKGHLSVLWTLCQPRRETVTFSLKASPENDRNDASTKKLVFNLKSLNPYEGVASWRPGTLYQPKVKVLHENMMYQCTEAHISGGVFDADVWRRKGLEKNAIADPSQPGFFSTPRGIHAVSHAIDRARRYLLPQMRSRKIVFETEIAPVWNITCDHQLSVVDPLRPNDQLTGKVISYAFQIDGQTGQHSACIEVAKRTSKPPVEQALKHDHRSPGGIGFSFKGHETPKGILDPHSLTRQEIVEWVEINNKPEEQERFLQGPETVASKVAYVRGAGGTGIHIHLKKLTSGGILEHAMALDIAPLTDDKHS